MNAPTVFISYSWDSDEHKDRVLEFANRLRVDGIDASIDQYELSPAEGWPKWMDRHIAKDDFVIVVCTEIYNRRVMDEEEKGKGRGIKWESTLTAQHIYDNESLNMRFIPVLFDDGNTKHIPVFLRGATRYSLPKEYDQLYRRLTRQPETVKPELGKLKSLPPRERQVPQVVTGWAEPDKVSRARLPSTSPDLFGREKELEELDHAWDGHRSSTGSAKVNILTLVAWGGVGKSALVNKWLTDHMAKDNYRGARYVFGWSFYSQGAEEGRQVSADQFIADALEWFGDSDPNAGSPWDKGERLAALVKQARALLILDGLEPLQNPPPVETGYIKDPALRALLRELADHNPGLVVITTRLAVDNLKDWLGTTVIECNLEALSDKDGADYLKSLGVVGTVDECQAASRDFGGHALALTLLGSYLKVVYHGDIRRRGEIPRLTDDQKQGGHARRVLASYERWLKGKPELDILRLLGLFDRPAEGGAIDALRKKPLAKGLLGVLKAWINTNVIKGLTDNIQNLSDKDWNFAVQNLRNLRLLVYPERSPQGEEELDCHPLLREHFSEQLKQTNLAAWREGHRRLYEYYKAVAKEYPDTLQEMAPLYAAVLHGCQAGKHQEVLDGVYWKRIQREEKFFATKNLGVFGADLAALSGFFDGMSWRSPVGGLHEGDKGFVVGQAGIRLRALGRLAEAAEPMQAGLDAAIEQKDWQNAAIRAGNLSELYLTMGNITQALAVAKQSVELADRSGNAFQRAIRRTTLANVLHQVGYLSEAQAAFQEAEEIQKQRQPDFPLLYSLQGYCYCDLLLGRGDYAEVEQRANQTLEWATQYLSLLDIALDYLSLGRARLLQAQCDPNYPITESLSALNSALEGLRQAGTQHHLPRALLVRAEYYSLTGTLDRIQKDLDEAFSIAERGGMGLYLVNCHLGYARLALARSLQEDARRHLNTAKEMIDRMGYHRRDGEVEEIERLLGGG